MCLIPASSALSAPKSRTHPVGTSKTRLDCNDAHTQFGGLLSLTPRSCTSSMMTCEMPARHCGSCSRLSSTPIAEKRDVVTQISADKPRQAR